MRDLITSYISSYNRIVNFVNAEMAINGITSDYTRIPKIEEKSFDKKRQDLTEYIVSFLRVENEQYVFPPLTILPDIEIIGEHEIFGMHEHQNIFYACELGTKKIVCFDDITGEVAFYCVENLKTFIHAMNCMLELELLFYTDKASYESTSQRERTLSQCIFRAGGIEYEAFYNSVISLNT